MRVIFLDVDGVLNRHEEVGVLGPVCVLDETLVNRFNDTVTALEPVSTVLSSSWRLFPHLLERVRTEIGIFDVTPHIQGATRGAEVQQWLLSNAHMPTTRYLIIDDQNNFYPSQQQNLLLAHWSTGFSAELAERTLAHFTRPRQVDLREATRKGVKTIDLGDVAPIRPSTLNPFEVS